ncbi:SDR family NAD(P)-dependent oxidoreductase [Nitrososphaera sp.]|uniref:SDR family NAD(P)-dependent oxidoreductase n=1 Tax=Nitrososphaera sp. TaxID=1971748 RepID=UPI00307D6DF2
MQHHNGHSKIIVTGGSGFIGSHLVKKLKQDGYQIAVIDRAARGGSAGRPLVQDDGVSYYRADIRDAAAINAIFAQEKPDSCVHLAALISVAESVKDPASTLDVNVNGTANVLDACSAHGVANYVFASTGAVYGEPKQFPIKEEHPLDPLSPYGASKVAGEMLAAAYRNCKKIENAISLRFFNVYGVGQSPAYAGVITRFAERLSQGLPPLINGDGMQTRDFVHVDDIAKGITLALKAAGDRGLSGTFNLATGHSITINELARQMIKVFGVDVTPVYREEQKGDVRYAQVDISQAQGKLGYLPAGKLEEALAEMFRPQAVRVTARR